MRLRRAGSVVLLVLVGLFNVVRADDSGIARELADQLRSSKASNDLAGFRIGVKVENGVVWMKGQVNDESQREHALNLARRIDGVNLVVNDLTLPGEKTKAEQPPVRQVNNEAPMMDAPPAQMLAANAPMRSAQRAQRIPARAAPQHIGRASRAGGPVPVAHHNQRIRPVQYVAEGAGCSSGGCDGGCGRGSYCSGRGAPMPETGYYGGGGGYADGGFTAGMSFEQPQMPGHAWPSYASYPNYGAVTYPKQYSPNAWPYIGPFYPYPQVPMGWRKVSLEWDDGWWFLDFKSK